MIGSLSKQSKNRTMLHILMQYFLNFAYLGHIKQYMGSSNQKEARRKDLLRKLAIRDVIVSVLVENDQNHCSRFIKPKYCKAFRIGKKSKSMNTYPFTSYFTAFTSHMKLSSI